MYWFPIEWSEAWLCVLKGLRRNGGENIEVWSSANKFEYLPSWPEQMDTVWIPGDKMKRMLRSRKTCACKQFGKCFTPAKFRIFQNTPKKCINHNTYVLNKTDFTTSFGTITGYFCISGKTPNLILMAKLTYWMPFA